MASHFRVTISVEVTGPVVDTNSHKPVALTWSHTLTTGDNPRYYGMELQRAIEEASVAAHANAAVYLPVQGETS